MIKKYGWKLKTSIDETNLRLIKGTEEQYMVLSTALDNDRILCTGGGGTGDVNPSLTAGLDIHANALPSLPSMYDILSV